MWRWSLDDVTDDEEPDRQTDVGLAIVSSISDASKIHNLSNVDLFIHLNQTIMHALFYLHIATQLHCIAVVVVFIDRNVISEQREQDKKNTAVKLQNCKNTANT